MTHTELIDLFFTESPYQDFPLKAYPEKIAGWHSDHPVFERLIKKHKPKLYIEVGTWLGASALHACECLRKSRLATPVICVDTWLGAQEFWYDIRQNARYKDLSLRHGYPGIFHQFIANVLHRGHQDRIVPLPQTSAIAARIFRHHRLSPDLVYIDGSHDPGDVMADMEAYWELLSPGGSLFGDDYDEFWPDLVRDVNTFAAGEGVKPEVDEGMWILSKPAKRKPTTKVPVKRASASILADAHAENAVLRARLISKEAHMEVIVAEKNAEISRREADLRHQGRELDAARLEQARLESTAGYHFEQCKQLERAMLEKEAALESLKVALDAANCQREENEKSAAFNFEERKRLQGEIAEAAAAREAAQAEAARLQGEAVHLSAKLERLERRNKSYLMQLRGIERQPGGGGEA